MGSDAADAGPSGEDGKEEGRRSGMTIGSFSYALACELQTVKCLTFVDTEGGQICDAGALLPLRVRLWIDPIALGQRS